jgi:spore germination cell wall hydrolase CwlJ-like protein
MRFQDVIERFAIQIRPAASWRYAPGAVAALAMLGGAGSLLWASHAPLGARADGARSRRLPSRGDGGFTLADFHPFGRGLGSSAWSLAQRYDPLARIAGAGLPDAGGAPTAPAPTAAPPAQTFEDLSPQQAALINASIPFSRLPNPAAKPFRFPAGAVNDRARALTCLTMAVYYEAASESDIGQAAVAQVVLNRVRNPLFPKSICAVVFQGSTLPTGCQFTFTCDGALNRRPSQAGWLRARQIAGRALDGFVLKSVGEATHYHTQWVVPYWQPTLVKETQIGAHIFYRWMGGLGLPGAFTGQYAGFEPPPPPIPGFDSGPTTVMVSRGDTPPTLAEVAQIETPEATREAVQAITDAPVGAPPTTIEAPAASVPAAPAGPPKPVYFGKPFRQRHTPVAGG